MSEVGFTTMGKAGGAEGVQPIGIGMKKDEPQLLAKVNGALYALEKSGELDRLWAKWLGPNTEYKLVREEKVMPLADLKFELLP